MKNTYSIPNAEILMFLTKEDILSGSRDDISDPTVPDIGVEDEGDF